MAFSTKMAFGLLAISAMTSTASAATTYLYASPSGGGSTCSLSSPCSLTGAQSKVRTLNSSMSGDIVVQLFGGTYALSSTFALNNSDSGTNGYNVIYRAYGGDVPVLSGGKLITGWSLYDGAKNIYRASVGGDRFRQLYVNDARATRAREPNVGEYQTIDSWDTTNRWINLDGTAPTGATNLTQIELVTHNCFTSNHLRLSWSDATSVMLQSPEDNLVYDIAVNYRGNRYFYENAYEFIDQAGEWYLNASTNYLYYKQIAGQSMSGFTVIAPHLETIVSITGTSLASPAHHIQFQGVQFKHSNWLYPNSNGAVEFQASQIYSNTQTTGENSFMAPAGVNVKRADDIRFERNTFSKMGANGLRFEEGVHDSAIVGNVVFDTAGNGISEMKPNNNNAGSLDIYNPADSREINNGNTIRSNFVYNVGMDYRGGLGIFAGMTQHADILHNEVFNTPYTGISVGWGWTGHSSHIATDNAIDYNYVHDTSQETDHDNILYDGGSIYTLSDQPNSSISYNHLVYDDIQGAIFPDEESAYFTGVNNVIDAPGRNWLFIWHAGIHDNTFTDNYTNSSSFRNDGTNNVITGTVPISGQNWDAPSQSIISNAGIESGYQGIKTVLAEGMHNETTGAAFYKGFGRGYGCGSCFSGTQRSSNAVGSYYEVRFSGTRARIYGERDYAHGIVAVSVDGGSPTSVDLYSASSATQQLYFDTGNLSPGNHTIRVTITGKNGSAADYWADLDKIVVTNGAGTYNETHAAFAYSGFGSSYACGSCSSSDQRSSSTVGASYQFTFNGTRARIYGEKDYAHGIVAVSVDGASPTSVDLYSASSATQQLYFDTGTLSSGDHTIKLTITGKNASAADYWADLDKVVIN